MVLESTTLPLVLLYHPPLLFIYEIGGKAYWLPVIIIIEAGH